MSAASCPIKCDSARSHSSFPQNLPQTRSSAQSSELLPSKSQWLPPCVSPFSSLSLMRFCLAPPPLQTAANCCSKLTSQLPCSALTCWRITRSSTYPGSMWALSRSLRRRSGGPAKPRPRCFSTVSPAVFLGMLAADVSSYWLLGFSCTPRPTVVKFSLVFPHCGPYSFVNIESRGLTRGGSG